MIFAVCMRNTLYSFLFCLSLIPSYLSSSKCCSKCIKWAIGAWSMQCNGSGWKMRLLSVCACAVAVTSRLLCPAGATEARPSCDHLALVRWRWWWATTQHQLSTTPPRSDMSFIHHAIAKKIKEDKESNKLVRSRTEDSPLLWL